MGVIKPERFFGEEDVMAWRFPPHDMVVVLLLVLAARTVGCVGGDLILADARL